MNILIVEDNKLISMTVQAQIKKNGYSSVSVENAEEALDYISIHHPDLIIMDIDLPSMDGIELTRKIRELTKNHWIPIIFHSSHDESEIVMNAIEAGGDDYIVKPATSSELNSKIISARSFLNVVYG